MRKLDAHNIQEVFLEQLKSMLPSSTSLAAELSELLEISMDSAYRRIRGETPLSLSETYKLAQAHNISLANMSSENEGVVQFSYLKMAGSIDSMEQYLVRLLQNLKKIRAAGEATIFYCGQDVPLFHNLRYNYLARFKIFYWMRSIMNDGDITAEKLGEETIPQRLIDLCEEIFAEYKNINSKELWSTSSLHSTLRQLRYYWESGLLESDEFGKKVLNDVRSLLENIESMATSGWKNSQDEKGKYEFYASEIELTTNCAMAEMGGMRAVFLGHHTFNMLETMHETYSEQTSIWFRNMMSKATLISNVGEKYRYQFFQDGKRKIDRLEKDMLGDLD